MRKLFAIFALLGAVGWCAPLMAQDKPAAPAAAPAATGARCGCARSRSCGGRTQRHSDSGAHANKGDVAWMLTSTALVLMMKRSCARLVLRSLVRSKNMLSVLMQVFVTFSLITVIWCIYGYSLAFTEGNAFFGSLTDRLFLKAPSTR